MIQYAKKRNPELTCLLANHYRVISKESKQNFIYAVEHISWKILSALQKTCNFIKLFILFIQTNS